MFQPNPGSFFKDETWVLIGTLEHQSWKRPGGSLVSSTHRCKKIQRNPRFTISNKRWFSFSLKTFRSSERNFMRRFCVVGGLRVLERASVSWALYFHVTSSRWSQIFRVPRSLVPEIALLFPWAVSSQNHPFLFSPVSSCVVVEPWQPRIFLWITWLSVALDPDTVQNTDHHLLT